MTVSVVVRPARLRWRDFRQVNAIPDSDEEAQINPRVFLPEIKIVRRAGKFMLDDFVIRLAPNPRQTLVLKSADRTSDLLDHEQGHYDLMLLTVRVMAREFETLATESTTDLQSGYEKIKSAHEERAEAIDDEYDKQTDHSRDTVQQRRWRRLIDNALSDRTITEIDGKPF